MALKPRKIRGGLFNRPAIRLANVNSFLGIRKEEQNTLAKLSLWVKNEDYSKKNLSEALRNKTIVDVGIVQMLVYIRY